MTYSYTRFRKVLASVRILFGFIFTYYGATKLFDPNFFYRGYNVAVMSMGESAPRWYSGVVEGMILYPGKSAVLIGLVQLFVGLGLLLGLATRPACVVGMIYMVNRIVLSWRPPVLDPTLWHYLDAHLLHIALFSLLLIFAVEHAGETWGLGAVYHAHRFREIEEPETEAFERDEEQDEFDETEDEHEHPISA